MDRSGTRRGLLAGGIALVLGIWAILPHRPDPPGPLPSDPSPSEPDRDAPLAASASPSGAPSAESTTPGVRLSPLDPALVGRGRLTMRVVRAGTREPVVGANTVLHGIGHGGERIRVTATSDPDGRVTLVDVAAGPWLSLHVEASGLLATDRADVDVVRDATLDLGDIPLTAGRRLTVRVRDASGRPVTGATVEWWALDAHFDQAMYPGYADALRSALEHLPRPTEARTDASGTATFDDVPPGAVLLAAHGPGSVTARHRLEVRPEADPDLPELILREGVVVAGRIVDAAGQAIPSALLIATDTARAVRAADDPPRWCRSDADGRFVFRLPSETLPGGLWVVHGEHLATWIAIDDPTDDLRVVLADGVPFELSVANGATDFPVLDAGVRLTVTTESSGPDARWTWDARTDWAGRVVTRAPRGRLERIEVQADGFDDAYGPTSPPDGRPLDTMAVTGDLAAGGPVHVVVTLRPWPLLRLDGSVVDEQGKVVQDAVVSATNWGLVDSLVRTDAQGRFRAIVDARQGPPRNVELRVRTPGWVVRVPRAAVDVAEDGSDARVTLTVQPSATIRGRVVAQDGGGVVGAVVRWTGPRQGRSAPVAATGADGRFVLADLEPDGRDASQERAGRVVATAEGLRGASTADFQLVPGRTADVGTIVLTPGRVLDGLILDPLGAPAPGVRVTLSPVAFMIPPGLVREQFRFATTDAVGRFRVGDVDWRSILTAEPRGPGEVEATRPVEPDGPDAHLSVTLQLEAGAPLTGIVVDAAGTPQDAQVEYRQAPEDRADRKDAWSAVVATDQQGRFRFRSVPHGPATLWAFAGTLSGRVDVDAATTTPIRLVVVPSDEPPRVPIEEVPGTFPGHPLDTSR